MFTLKQATKAQRGADVQLYTSFNLGARWGGWSTPRPGRLTPGKETRYQFYRRLGGPQGRSGRVQKISPPPGFDPRTVQPVASRYTTTLSRPPKLLPIGSVLYRFVILFENQGLLLCIVRARC